MRVIVVATVLLALQACATMDVAECRTADWHAVGYEDGAKGRAVGYLGTRRADCAKHGVTPDFEAYVAGRKQGLNEFCRPQKGYQLGARGRKYSGVCPKNLEGEFLAAHADGYGLFELRRRVRDIHNRLQRSKTRIHKIERLLAEKTALLVGARLHPSKRAILAAEIKQLAEEKGALQQTIHPLEHDYSVATRDHDEYRSRMAPRYGNRRSAATGR